MFSTFFQNKFSNSQIILNIHKSFFLNGSCTCTLSSATTSALLMDSKRGHPINNRKTKPSLAVRKTCQSRSQQRLDINNKQAVRSNWFCRDSQSMSNKMERPQKRV